MVAGIWCSRRRHTSILKQFPPSVHLVIPVILDLHPRRLLWCIQAIHTPSDDAFEVQSHTARYSPVLQRAMWSASKTGDPTGTTARKKSLSFRQRQVPQILAVELKNVDGHKMLRRLATKQRIKLWFAEGVQGNDLAVDDCFLDRETTG